MESTRSTGDRAEEYAAEFLSSLGYEIIDRQFRTGHLEIDIICAHGDMLVFVEVKYRGRYEHPADAVPRGKQRLLLEAATQYVEKFEDDREVRMDVILLWGKIESPVVEHFPGAFDGYL